MSRHSLAPPRRRPSTRSLRRSLAAAEARLAEQRRQAAANLALLEEFIATAPIGRALVDGDLRFVLINELLAEINGKPAAEHLGHTVAEVLPQIAPTLEPILRRVLDRGEPALNIELSGSTPKEPGRLRQFLASYYPMRTFRGVNIVVKEITERKEAEARIRASEERFRTLTDYASEFIFRYRLGPPLVVEYVSPSAAAFTGYTPEEYVADPELGFRQVHPDDQQSLARFRADPASLRERIELRWIRKDGRVIWVEQSARLIRDDDGRPVVFQGVVRDITERKQAEAALRASEERFRTMIETSQDLIVLTDAASRLLYLSPASTALLGYAPEELVGHELRELVHPGDLAGIIAQHGDLQQSRGTVVAYVVRLRHRDGDWRWFRVTRNNQLDNPVLGAVIGSLQDVTEQRRAEELSATALQAAEATQAELEASQARLRATSERLVDVQEEERRHLARELHDEIGQALTGLSLQLAAIAALSPDQAPARLEDARRQVGALIGIVRRRSLDLSPPLLDDLGLRAVMEWYLDRYRERTAISVSFASNLDRRLPRQIELTAYRIVQEALTNIARHAATQTAQVRLWTADDRLLIQVDDQGSGFDPQRALAARASSGLNGMRERASLLGGHLAIESEPGGGTHVLADLPLHAGLAEEVSL